MTDHAPQPDQLPEESEAVGLSSQRVGRASAVVSTPGAVVVAGGPSLVTQDEALSYESGVEVKARSQWTYVRIRFFRHRLAVASLIILILISLVAIFANHVAPYGYDELDLNNIAASPSLNGWHLFGTDLLGRDYLSRVIFGLRTSLWVAFFVAILSTAIGTAIGSIAGYYGGAVDNLLMRMTDLFLVLPFLAVLLVLSAFFGHGNPTRVGIILAVLLWTGLARILRGIFLSLREKEFVEAAKAAGASDFRIIVRHILPNCVGPIVVTATLFVATAILLEAALSFLGFGIQPPHPALGSLIADGETQGFNSWWLVTFPGLVIVVVALCVNFIGDGLRDALDPTQRRVRA
jgi:ABC-type dipeptide/oligopeptide/nickel transport system permease subunit